jgi:hypothetical protein
LGIAHITDATLASKIAVGILKSIFLVNFGSTSCVLMEGSWIAGRYQGRANVKKDQYGFWTIGFDNREDARVKNPFAFPEKVSQVFSWRIVVTQGRRLLLGMNYGESGQLRRLAFRSSELLDQKMDPSRSHRSTMVLELHLRFQQCKIYMVKEDSL